MNNTPNPFLTSKAYNHLKYAVQIVLPAAGTLYFTLAQIWALPYGEQVVGTITAIALFGGILIGVDKSRYEKSDQKYDGAMKVDASADEEYMLEFKKELPDLAGNKEIVLKVDRVSQ